VNIWATAPATEANAAVSTSADGGWRRSDPQPVTLTATGGHGTATIHYQVGDGAQVDLIGADAGFVVSGDGSHRVVYWSTDSLGNAEAQHTGYVNIDATAPVTDDTYAGGSAWQTGPLSFSLTPSDSGSGMMGGSAATTYRIDDGASQSGTDVMVVGDGEHIVRYSSTDVAGNGEGIKTVMVRIDAAAPVTGDDAPAAWQNGDTAVTLTPTDLLSGMVGGLAGTTFELDGGATEAGTTVQVAALADHSNDGTHEIAYRSADVVGNREADKIATVLIDTLPPETRDDIIAGPPAHTDPVTVTLSPSDDNGARDVSGVAATHYRIDDGAWRTGSSVEVTGDGQHTVSYYSTDNAGNDEAVKTSRTVTIGTAPPGASTDDAPAAWVNHDVTLTITPGERAVRTTYELDAGPTQTGTSVVVEAPATHANDGEHVITYRSWTIGDVAETTRTAVVRIDTTAPHTSDNAPVGWQHGPVTLTLDTADASSGVAETTYAIDGGAQRQGTSVVVSGDGTHTVTYFSTDNVGNVEAAESVAVRIDDTAPRVTCPQAGRWFKTKTVTARITATDAGSGVRDIAYRLGQGAWRTGSSVRVKGLGRHIVSFRATDANGNVCTATSSVIGIDRGRPKVTRCLGSHCKRSGQLTLRMRITDPKPSCGGARVVKIVITNPRGKKVATITKLGKVVRTNATVQCPVTYKLKRGFYRFRVYVVDLAGNKQKKASPGKLAVK
jgi:large repetitive protein